MARLLAVRPRSLLRTRFRLIGKIRPLAASRKRDRLFIREAASGSFVSRVRQNTTPCICSHPTTILNSFGPQTITVSTLPLNYFRTPRISSTTARPARNILHLVALLTACATFPLIFMGGLVTSHQAGMSVPDWPNSYGYNMFLFPPSDWVGGIFYEHTHRLMGTVVGFCSIVLVLVAWGSAQNRNWRRVLGWSTLAFALPGTLLGLLHHPIAQQIAIVCIGIALCCFIAFFCRVREPRRWVRWLTVVVLGAVVLQGVLGGLRVVLVKLDLAIVHACVAQAFFCLTAFAAVATSSWWQTEPRPASDPTFGRRLVWLGIVTVFAIYAQLIVGATMRHFQAGLAIPDLPLAYGKLLPPVTAQQLDAINWLRTRQLNLESVTLTQIWLHFGHRIGALLVTVLVTALAAMVIRRYRMHPRLVRPAILLLGLLVAQLTLGTLTVLLRKPADVASAHVAIGAAVLVTSFVLTVRAARIFGIRFRQRTPENPAIVHSERPLAVA